MSDLSDIEFDERVNAPFVEPTPEDLFEEALAREEARDHSRDARTPTGAVPKEPSAPGKSAPAAARTERSVPLKSLRAVPDAAPRPPSTLTPDGASLWRTLQEEYGIDDAGGLTLLRLACEAFDRMHRAAALVREHGEVIFPVGLAPRANPACAVERDARAQMMQALKGLHLDIEPLQLRAGRPSGR